MRIRDSVCGLLCFFMFAQPAFSNELRPVVILFEPSRLINEFKLPVRELKVMEPHVSTPEKPVGVTYIGFDSAAVFSTLLGDRWESFDGDIELRALDGYVSRIEISRFKIYRSILAYSIKGQTSFRVDNPGQNQKEIPLGPYYLVWDNVSHRELQKDGAADWPYQIDRIQLSNVRKAALLPGNLARKYSSEAKLAQKHCLTCHQISGYGGDKWPGDLARSVSSYERGKFMDWVLNPQGLKPGTEMPALLPNLPYNERLAIADRLFEYLKERANF